MPRAIVLSAGDEDAINAALGYPRAGLRTDHSIAAGAGVTTKHREAETDTLARRVLVVDGIEARLSAALRARVANVAIAAIVEPVLL